MEKYDSGEIRKEPVYYLRLLNKHKYLMAVCVIIAAILTFLHSKAAAPVYTASTKIVIKKSNIDPLTGMPIDIWDHKFVETQVQIIKSVAVGKRVVESLDLVNTYKDYVPEDANKGVLQNIKHNWISLYHNLSGHPADAPMEKNASPKTGRAAASPGARAVKTNALDDGDYASAEAEFDEMISGGIDIEAITDSRVFIISYTSVNPVLARSITNSVVDSYGNQVLDMQATSIKKSLRWMTREATAQRGRLEAAERALQEYVQRNEIVTIEDRMAIIPQKLAETSQQLTLAETKRKRFENIKDSVNAAVGDFTELRTIPSISRSERLRSIEQIIFESEQQIIQLSRSYKEKHPLIVSLT